MAGENRSGWLGSLDAQRSDSSCELLAAECFKLVQLSFFNYWMRTKRNTGQAVQVFIEKWGPLLLNEFELPKLDLRVIFENIRFLGFWFSSV